MTSEDASFIRAERSDEAVQRASLAPPYLLPCPFCGGKAYFERTGTRNRSCQVACGNCSTHHESSDEYDRSGNSWNTRSTPPTAPVAPRQDAPHGYSNDEVSALRRDAERYLSAIRWALGYDEGDPEFRNREPGEGAYWWRKELRRRAAIDTARATPEPK